MEQTTNRFFKDEQGKAFSVQQVKTNLLPLVDADLYAILSKTDWQVTRANDPTSLKPVSPEVLQERQAARDNAESLIASITAATTLQQLQQIYTANLS